MRSFLDDDQIRKTIWEGTIPVIFQLSPREITSLSSPHPYYVMIPRQSYFNVYRQEVRDHFVEFTSSFDKKDDIWFEFQEKPLSWHQPAGVLFDLKANPSQDLPWNITVHFMDFPQEKIFKFANPEDLQWNYMNTLKEV